MKIQNINLRLILIGIFISLIFSFPVILPFFHTGYFPTHDGEWAVVRLADMFRTLRDFQIPVRFSGALNFGYGYPLFNFAYPFPYYLGTLIHLFGFRFVDTIKILFALSVPLSAFFMFLASSALWKNRFAGAISAVLYIYLPYRMVDLYVRGSLGESLSFILFPLLFYSAGLLIKDPFSRIWPLAISFSVAVLVTTHNIMTVLFIPVFSTFIITQIIIEKKKIALMPIFLSILMGLGLSAFFWMPALLEKQYILLSKIPIADRNLYFLSIDQFVRPSWGYGVPTGKDAFSYQIGLPHLAVFLSAILLLISRAYKDSPKETLFKTTLALVTIWIILFFLLFSPSLIIWENLPFLKEINYPWTLLSQIGFLTSLLGGFLFTGGQFLKYSAAFFTISAFLFVLPYAKPQYYVDRGDNFYITNAATTTSSQELMPLWVKKMPTKEPDNKVEIIRGQGKVETISYNSKQISFSVDLLFQSTIRINIIYYPGWRVFVDDQNTAISYANEQGVIDIFVPSGKHAIKASFTETPVRLISDIISIVSMFVVLLMYICRRRIKA